MQYGIQRRTIYVVPALPEDLEWIFELFERREIWEMFGFDGPGKEEMIRRHASGNLVIGIARRVADRRRIGFGILFPPTDHLGIWEYGVVIPEREDRDAFSAIAASDAMSHYVFDHLRIEAAIWRIRADNRASIAIAQRMGYRPFGTWEVGGHRFRFFRLNQEIWAKRRAKLDEGEATRPSGLGSTFLTLSDPPFDPEPT